jgi:hypothetical protein
VNLFRLLRCYHRPRCEMSNKKHPGGRPPAKILTDNFSGSEKVNNKSCRKIWKCNYCTPTSGNDQPIEGQDNQSSDVCEDSSIKDSRGHLILDRPSLTVRTFETLGKLRNNYSYHIYQRALSAHCWQACSTKTCPYAHSQSRWH